MKSFLIYVVLWCVYYPFVSVLKYLLFWHPKVRERMAFEEKNGKDLGSQSWRQMGLEADHCFEFSSEGEFQQVASLIYDSLREGKRLELVFFSPSVEKTIVDLAHQFSTQVRYFRYPVLSLEFSNWVTAKSLILVRYDFFLELLAYGASSSVKLKLLWITFKKERLKKAGPSFLKRQFLKEASMIFFATAEDEALGKSFGFLGKTYDFRMEQIQRRVLARDEKLTQKMKYKLDFEKILQQYPRNKRVILGNAWPVDLQLIKDLPQDFLLVIVPHQLREEIVSNMKNELTLLGRLPEVATDETRSLKMTSTLLISQKGILCELYADFGFAYIGGGLGVSVHSILEPLVGGSDLISCGPNHFRSTEFDLARGFDKMTELRTSKDFVDWLNLSSRGHGPDLKLRAEVDCYPFYRKDVLAC